MEKGEQVHAYRNAGFGLGAMLLAFDDVEEMDRMMDRMWEYAEVVLDDEK